MCMCLYLFIREAHDALKSLVNVKCGCGTLGIQSGSCNSLPLGMVSSRALGLAASGKRLSSSCKSQLQVHCYLGICLYVVDL